MRCGKGIRIADTSAFNAIPGDTFLPRPTTQTLHTAGDKFQFARYCGVVVHGGIDIK